MPRRCRTSSMSPESVGHTSQPSRKIQRTVSPVFYQVIDDDDDDDDASDLELDPRSTPKVSQPAVIDHSYFPHIMDAILDAVSFETLLTFRATATSYRDSIDRTLAHIEIVERDREECTDGQGPSRIVEARSRQGYLLWEVPLNDREQRALVLPRINTIFYRYAAFHSSRNVTVNIDLYGNPDAHSGIISGIFFAALGEGPTRRPSPLTRFHIYPDEHGRTRPQGHAWDGPRILEHAHRVEESNCDARINKDFVISVRGGEEQHICNTRLPMGSTIVFDFTHWTPRAKPSCCNEVTRTPGMPAEYTICKDAATSRMDNFITHIVRALYHESVIYIFGLQLVDPKWLSTSRTGHLNHPSDGAALPLTTYIREAVLRELFAHGEDFDWILEDLDMYFNIMPLRYSWQSFCSW